MTEPYSVSALARITHVTADADATRRFYADLMNLHTVNVGTNESRQTTQRRLWGVPEAGGWQETVYRRTAFDETPDVRVLAMDAPGAPTRPGMHVLLHGGLSVGFSSRDKDDLLAFIEHAKTLGIETTAGLTTIDLHRPDGSPYEALETHFIAPDFVYGLGVGRPEDLPKVAPIVEGEPVGGPAYSAQVCNNADPELAFYRDVMHFDIRRDVTLTSSGPAGGLDLAPGTAMRFIQIYAPGTDTAYLVMLDFPEGGKPNPTPLSPPNTGVVIWSFRTDDLDATLAAVGECDGAAVIGEPTELEDETFGTHRLACVQTPRGFLLELIEA